MYNSVGRNRASTMTFTDSAGRSRYITYMPPTVIQPCVGLRSNPSTVAMSGLDCKWNCYEMGGNAKTCQQMCCHTTRAPRIEAYGYWNPQMAYKYYVGGC